MDKSVFMDKENKPTNEQLELELGDLFNLWCKIRDYVFELYENATEEWNYPGKNYGWSYKIKDKKRAIIYLLPREKYFKVAFVFGEKALQMILSSSVDLAIKNELLAAKKYAEGRGIRIDVKNDSIINDIITLIQIKLAN